MAFFSSIKVAQVNYGIYITRSIPGYTTANCLAECFFTPFNDCHFAVTNTQTKVCSIGTFKLWPLESASTSTVLYTVYIYGGELQAWWVEIKILHLFLLSIVLFLPQNSKAGPYRVNNHIYLYVVGLNIFHNTLTNKYSSKNMVADIVSVSIDHLVKISRVRL